MSIRIHPTADVSEGAKIGDGTRIWHQCQVREGAPSARTASSAKACTLTTA